MDNLQRLSLFLIFLQISSVYTSSVAGYYATWANPWTSSGSQNELSTIAAYVTNVYLSFGDPSTNYVKGSKTFSGTGIQFSSDPQVIIDAVTAAKSSKPNQKFIVSFGGATYPWPQSPNYQAMCDFVDDFGFDGIDIDFESYPQCQNIDTAQVTCSTDSLISSIITGLSGCLGGKFLSAAPPSCSAYGNGQYPNAQYGPNSPWAGMFVNPLLQSGSSLSAINIMSYDAGNSYSPTDAFAAYKFLLSNAPNTKIYIGIEIPPEAWGGHVTSPSDAQTLTQSVVSNGGEGSFIWAIRKQGASKDQQQQYFTAICNGISGSNCNAPIY